MRIQRNLKFVSLLASVASCVLWTANPQSVFGQATNLPSSSQTQPAPAPSTGQRIGTIIKDAISTAFPGVSGIAGIINAIWGANPNNGRSMNQNQLTTAVTNSQDNIKKGIVAQAQGRLTSLELVANELQIVSLFGVPTVTASTDIISMSDRLKSAKTLSKDDWTAMQGDWGEAKEELASIKTIPDLSKVQDLWLRDKLTKIQRANITFVTRIDNEMKPEARNTERLKDLLDGLYSTLQDISAAVGYEVSDMQADLKGLSDWAKGAAGSEGVISPQEQKFKAFLDKKYQ